MESISVSALPAQEVTRARVRRGCHNISAYTAGFEDTRYDRQYANPFTPHSTAWQEYDRGNRDARKVSGRDLAERLDRAVEPKVMQL